MLAESVSMGGPGKGGPSMDNSHVSALQLKHAGIEKKIDEEMSRPLPDGAKVRSLKKEKLLIKEQLSRH